ncbi:hypothetical protein FDECE_14898 [Fusarium decemcellulare]|nr:hypothetical protein FDECE_14898 [Fusarium decemcellulare]
MTPSKRSQQRGSDAVRASRPPLSQDGNGPRERTSPNGLSVFPDHASELPWSTRPRAIANHQKFSTDIAKPMIPCVQAPRHHISSKKRSETVSKISRMTHPDQGCKDTAQWLRAETRQAEEKPSSRSQLPTS